MDKNQAVQDAAHSILDDVVAVQTAVSGQCMVPVVVRQGLRNIQIQARALLAGGKAEPFPDGPIGQGYRLDVLDVLQGLTSALVNKTAGADGDRTDEELHLIALAAEAAHNRINNYLLVKRAENLIRRREGSNGLAQLTA
jgi:hypothetical protein